MSNYPTVSVKLEFGPLHGVRMEVETDVVNILQALDDGAVVCYERWNDLVFRYDPANSDGAAFGQVC
jgi:hypothetical protein